MTSRGKLYFFEFAIQEDFMESSTSSQATVYQSYKQVFPKEEGSIFLIQESVIKTVLNSILWQ